VDLTPPELMASSVGEELDDFRIRFQEAHGARLFRKGKPRALLEVKSPSIPTAAYRARLRGYDRAKTAHETPMRKKGPKMTIAPHVE
jgi:hypothetical protein